MPASTDLLPTVKPVVEIDGAQFSTLEAFFVHFEQVALCARWGRNLDAFNDVLRGGFGTPEGGFVLCWKNHELSKQRLDHTETARQLRIRLVHCHPTHIESVQAKLALALQGEGPTVFDWLIEIIRDHSADGAEPEDGVELRLE